MKSDNTETSETNETTKLGETELEGVTGGVRPLGAAINLDSFITTISKDRLRAIAGMDRPKGTFVNVRDVQTLDTSAIQNLSTNARLTRGL